MRDDKQSDSPLKHDSMKKEQSNIGSKREKIRATFKKYLGKKVPNDEEVIKTMFKKQKMKRRKKKRKGEKERKIMLVVKVLHSL